MGKEMRKVLRLIALAFAASIVLSGCTGSTSSGNSQVLDSGQSSARVPQSGRYQVQRGDTLYSIAFRFGWDWQALAAHNRIQPPYLIRPGQLIHLGRAGASEPSVAQNQPPVSRSGAAPNNKTGLTVSTQQKTSQSQSASKPAPSTTGQVPVGAKPSSGGWVWPSQGTLIGRFSSNGSLNKGIDIGGNLGQPVFAASGGSVVYAGSGLRGYGELLIIKHSDTYVSAYGHNQRLMVREGQQVKAGQIIAEMGSSGTDRVKLHFEIRRQGKPVDPLQYLPAR